MLRRNRRRWRRRRLEFRRCVTVLLTFWRNRYRLLFENRRADRVVALGQTKDREPGMGDAIKILTV